MEIKIVKEKISLDEIKKIANESYGEMTKAVVDAKREIMAVGGELHSDSAEKLFEDGSDSHDLWGINIYPWKPKGELIEYNSLINIKPVAGNRSMDIEIPEIKERIKIIVENLIQ